MPVFRPSVARDGRPVDFYYALKGYIWNVGFTSRYIYI